ncbi:hypothetical protein BJV78DRAFT_1241662, partial [Lactifluus subvellereus]
MKFSVIKCVPLSLLYAFLPSFLIHVRTTTTTCNTLMASLPPPRAPSFPSPAAFRTTQRQWPGKPEGTHMLEDKCHRCARWVPVQGVKDANAR